MDHRRFKVLAGLLRRCPGLMAGLLLVSSPRPALAQPGAMAAPPILPGPSRGLSRRLPPPSADLLRSLRRLDQDLTRLDATLPDGASGAPTGANPLPPLRAPAPRALPGSPQAVTIQERPRLSLRQALNLAVSHDPDLSEAAAAVLERSALVRAARGRWWPELGLALGGRIRQGHLYNQVWNDNAGLYPTNSPFLVKPDGWNLIQSTASSGFGGLDLAWALIDPARAAALAENDQDWKASRQRYADRLRQLQLDVSQSYYGLQLADQRLRIRQAVVDSDRALRDQVMALVAAGLMPRLDLLRAEARLQQGYFRLRQAEAERATGQRQLSNLINVPFDVTLLATEAVRLQPPWPLDLPQTLWRGLDRHPLLLALEASRAALLRQADRRAAALQPKLRVLARAGYAEGIDTNPVISLNGCCSSALIPRLYSQSADWAAALELSWRLFDGGVTAGEVAASRAAAQRTEQQLARQRNSIRQRLEAAYYQHQAALEQIVAARSAYAASREAFRDARARYQLGLSDYTDLSDTITALSQALEGVAESTTLANLSYAQLLRDLVSVPDQPGGSPELPLRLEPAAAVGAPAGSAAGAGATGAEARGSGS